MSMTVIEHIEVGSGGAASITFSAIPADYTDLYLVYSLRDTQGGYFGYTNIELNGSASNHTQRRLRGNGSSASAGTNTSFEIAANASATTSNTFNNGQIYIPNYTSASVKSASIDFVMENNVTEGYQQIAGGLYNSTSAVSSIEIASGGSFVEYSSATLYGITAGSDGTTVVS